VPSGGAYRNAASGAGVSGAGRDQCAGRRHPGRSGLEVNRLTALALLFVLPPQKPDPVQALVREL
jgi:hypothetical protein